MTKIRKGSLCVHRTDFEWPYTIAGPKRVLVSPTLESALYLYSRRGNDDDFGRYSREEVELLVDQPLIFWHEEE